MKKAAPSAAFFAFAVESSKKHRLVSQARCFFALCYGVPLNSKQMFFFP